MPKPLVFDLYCGLGGFTSGFLEEGWNCVGFDIERHVYGDQEYPAQLVLQDVLTLHGKQFKNARCIVASPPCTEYSYMAMPWSRAKQVAAALRGTGEFPEGYAGSRTIEQLNVLFKACFRIQREACEAAGRHIPMVVENVKGAQPWVGPAKAHYGSFYLWGDVDQVGDRIIAGRMRVGEGLRAAKRGLKANPDGTNHGQGSWFKVADSKERGSGVKVPGMDWSKFGEPGYKAEAFNPTAEQRMRDGNQDGRKVPGMNFHEYEKTGKPGRSFQSAAVDGMKGFVTGLGKGHDWRQDPSGRFNSKSIARKAASAEIAKIPLALSRHLARSFKEEDGVS